MTRALLLLPLLLAGCADSRSDLIRDQEDLIKEQDQIIKRWKVAFDTLEGAVADLEIVNTSCMKALREQVEFMKAANIDLQSQP